MLEDQLQILNGTIIELIALLKDIKEPIQKVYENAHAAPASTEGETKKEETPPSSDDAVSELHQLCLGLVRKNKENKEKILKIIADHGGKMLKDVPVEKLPSLKIALEKLP